MIPLFETIDTTKFSDTDHTIYTYFTEHLRQAIYMNLAELANVLYTSNATIVRFCKKLGFQGYNEFKYEVRRQLEQKEEITISSQDLINRSLATFRDNLDAIDIAKLEEIRDIICTRRSLYIYGSGLSSIPAKYLQTILTTLDYPCILIEWRNLLEGITYTISKNSILFVITTHGDAGRYQSIFEQARKRGCTLILITCEETSVLSSYCDITIQTNDQSREFHNIDINPRIGILTVIQILIEMVGQKTL